MTPAVASAVLAFIPSPDRGVWYLGPIPIRAYALCIIAGIIIAVVWGERRFVARGGQSGTVTDVAVFAVPFGLVGGRLYHVATDWPTYFGPGRNPLKALEIWEGGLGIWGAVALGAVGAWIGCRRRGVPLPFFADAVAPGIVVAQAVGRLGNYFNQELYGASTDLPWGLEIYRRVDPATGLADPLGGVAVDHTPVDIVQPTFLYELILNLAVAAIVVWADRRFRLGHGRAFAVYVVGYTTGRFFIEQMRTDQATRVFGDIRINVVVSVVVFLGAVAYLVLVRKPREVLPAPDVAADPVTGSDAVEPADDEPIGPSLSKGSGSRGGVAVAEPDTKVTDPKVTATDVLPREAETVVLATGAATKVPVDEPATERIQLDQPTVVLAREPRPTEAAVTEEPTVEQVEPEAAEKAEPAVAEKAAPPVEKAEPAESVVDAGPVEKAEPAKPVVDAGPVEKAEPAESVVDAGPVEKAEPTEKDAAPQPAAAPTTDSTEAATDSTETGADRAADDQAALPEAGEVRGSDAEGNLDDQPDDPDRAQGRVPAESAGAESSTEQGKREG